MAQLRYGELREGVWVRPANLDPDRLHSARAERDRDCLTATATALEADASALWDLAGWSDTAEELLAAMAESKPQLAGGDHTALLVVLRSTDTEGHALGGFTAKDGRAAVAGFLGADGVQVVAVHALERFGHLLWRGLGLSWKQTMSAPIFFSDVARPLVALARMPFTLKETSFTG